MLSRLQISGLKESELRERFTKDVMEGDRLAGGGGGWVGGWGCVCNVPCTKSNKAFV